MGTEDNDATYVSGSSSLSSSWPSSQDDGFCPEYGAANLKVASIENFEGFQKGYICTSSQQEITKNIFSFDDSDINRNIKKGFIVTSPHEYKKQVEPIDSGCLEGHFYFSGSPREGTHSPFNSPSNTSIQNEEDETLMDSSQEKVTLATSKWKTQPNLMLADDDNSSVEENSKSSVDSDTSDKILCIQMYTSKKEKRFGFSVVGGTDEGIQPIINDVTIGKTV